VRYHREKRERYHREERKIQLGEIPQRREKDTTRRDTTEKRERYN
jgi:hypothetical protein